MKKINDRICTCPKCHSTWLFEPFEVVNNCVKCTCGEEIAIFPLYPDSFYHTSVKLHAKEMSDEWINGAIKDCIIGLKENPSLEYWYIVSGSCFVATFRDEDGYTTIVTNDYYSYEGE